MRTRSDGGPGRGRRVLRRPASGLVLVALGAALIQTSASADRQPDGAQGSEEPARLTTPATTDPFVVAPAVRFEKADPPGPSRTAGPPERPAGPATPWTAAAAGVPVRLVVPGLGVDAPVVGITATDGVLVPPSDPQTLGWWSAGAVPGAAQGGALITGHTVSTGGGAFDDLDTLSTGDRVAVRTTAGTIGYSVTDVTIYRKASLAEEAATVFSQTVPGRLVLVTCEDWNGEIYLSNAVVIAEPLSRR